MRILTAITTVTALSLFAVAGCGGESFESGDDTQAGESGNGTGGSGKSGSGGTSGTGKGGSGGSAGSGVAGSGQAGTAAGSWSSGGDGASGGVIGTGGRGGASGSGGQSAGTGAVAGAGEAGSGGEGGQPEDICLLEPDSGPCDAAIERWFFNAERGVCQPFTYGGCEGNENNFETLEKCHAACSGHGVEDPTSCNNPTECVLTAASCCGSHPSPTISDVTAVNAASLADFTVICELVDCVSTLGPIPAHFGATCSNGHCLAFDIRHTEMTACSEPADCRLRSGLQCCESCSSAPDDFVALRNDVDLSPLVCGGAPIGCDACVPLPQGLAADCLEGNCEVIELSVPFDG